MAARMRIVGSLRSLREQFDSQNVLLMQTPTLAAKWSSRSSDV
jgi:hypothetical protein